MRENQSLIDLIGWGLIASIIAGLIILFTSCTVPRLAGPTVDDLAGSPMVMTWEPTYRPMSTMATAEINLTPFDERCDHFYIKQAHTITDTIQAGADYQACICIYCKEINVCK